MFTMSTSRFSPLTWITFQNILTWTSKFNLVE
jgi:hypothetical protein